jgi:hypothetical protein
MEINVKKFQIKYFVPVTQEDLDNVMSLSIFPFLTEQRMKEVEEMHEVKFVIKEN